MLAHTRYRAPNNPDMEDFTSFEKPNINLMKNGYDPSAILFHRNPPGRKRDHNFSYFSRHILMLELNIRFIKEAHLHG
jgi:hypothetical protein